jgi:hypothetical protein
MWDPGPDRFVVLPVAPRTGTTNANKNLHLRSTKTFKIWNRTSKLGRRRLRSQFVALCTTIRRGIDPGPKIAFSPVAPRTRTTNANKTLHFRSPKNQDLKGRPATTTNPVCTTTTEEWIQVLINCRLASGSPNGRADAEKLFVSDPQKYSGPGTGPQGYHGSEYEVSLQDTSQRNPATWPVVDGW